MDFESLLKIPILDSHIHFPFPEAGSNLPELMAAMHVARVNLVATPDLQESNHNPAVIHFKAQQAAGQVYICGALDYFSAQSLPEQMPQALADQVSWLHAAGFDGLKLLEGKPMVRRILGLPLDGPVYAPMWAQVEALGMPVVWHVADPEEFWDAQRCPDWARQSGWFYGDGNHPSKEALYAEVENILARHPRLKASLAHFYFLSADLPRAAAFLEAHPNVCFDLTPGSEMYYEFSRQPHAAREFFLRYQERLVYGTDIGAGAIGKPPAPLESAEALGRAWVVRCFLEGDGLFEPPAGVSHWRRAGETLRGIHLPEEVLHKIYCTNFERLFGANPAALNRPAAVQIMTRLAAVLDARAGAPVMSTARRVLQTFKV